MKVITILGVVALAALFLFAHAIPCLRIESSVASLLKQGRDVEALRNAKAVLDDRPCLCSTRAGAALATGLFEAIEMRLAKPEPDFAGSIALLGRYGKDLNEAGAAQRLARRVRVAQEDLITSAGRFPRALKEFASYRAAYNDSEAEDFARVEEPVLFSRYGAYLAHEGRIEEALQAWARLVRLPNTPGLLLDQAQEQAVHAAELAVRARIQQKQFGDAFQVLETAASNFAGPAMDKLQDAIDQEVFRRRLREGTAQAQPPVLTAKTGGAGSSVTVRNVTADKLTVLYRGPSELEVIIPPNGSRELSLVPGTYVVGAYGSAAKGRTWRGAFHLGSGRYSQAFVENGEPVMTADGRSKL